jgi:streptomycin 6-kinase
MLHAVEDLGPTVALLLERCDPGTPLSSMPEDLQDRVIARLLGRLWRDPLPGHPFRPLSEMCERWTIGFAARAARLPSPLDQGLVRTGLELFRHLAATATRRLLLCTDLHAGNVLASRRQPWLMIDPKPYVGDPAYDLLQHMLNCPAPLQTDPVGLCNRMAELTGMDRERTRLWLFARCVLESADWPQLAEVARRVAPT